MNLYLRSRTTGVTFKHISPIFNNMQIPAIKAKAFVDNHHETVLIPMLIAGTL